MKRFVTLTCLFASLMMANAKSVVFTLSNGTKVYYLLGGEKNPMMRFADGKVVVNADSYEFSDIKSFAISNTDDPTAIASLKAKPETSYEGNVLTIKDANKQSVRIFSVSGTKVDAEVTATDSAVIIDLNSLPAAAYIIKVGDTSFKVLKK